MRTDAQNDKAIRLFVILQKRLMRLLVSSSANAVHHENEYAPSFPM